MTPIIHWQALYFTLGLFAGVAFTAFGYWLTKR